jgi:hypothetical protein
VRYRLLGGPCNGQLSRDFATEPRDQTTIACGGAQYIYYRANPGVFQWLDVGAVSAVDVNTAQVGKAWHRLMHVISVESAQAIRRSQAARGRLKRLTR